MMKILTNSKNFKGITDAEFNWVVKVLQSSTKISHINTSNKLFSNFLQKWGKKIESSEKYAMMVNFGEEKQKIRGKIMKKS